MPTPVRGIRRVLVATCDNGLRAAIAQGVRSSGAAVTQAHTAREAIALLAIHPDLLIFDVHLPDPGCLALVDAANITAPVPIRIAMGDAAAADVAFALARRGVSRLLKGGDASAFAHALEGARPTKH